MADSAKTQKKPRKSNRYKPPVPKKRMTAALKQRFVLKLMSNGGKYNETLRELKISSQTLFAERNADSAFESAVLNAMAQGRELAEMDMGESRRELEKSVVNKLTALVETDALEWKGKDVIAYLLGDGRAANKVNINNENTINNTTLQPVQINLNVIDPNPQVAKIKAAIDSGQQVDLKTIDGKVQK